MKITDYKTDSEIQDAGYRYLREGLGAAGFIRFIQQFERGRGNYTKERYLWQKDYSVDDIEKEIKQGKYDG